MKSYMIFFTLTTFQLFGMNEKIQQDIQELNKQMKVIRIQAEQLSQEQKEFQKASSKYAIILNKDEAEIARLLQELNYCDPSK
jgi:uncharacterized protein YacL (UPF0231 family)